MQYPILLVNILVILRLIIALMGVAIILLGSIKSFYDFILKYLIKKDVKSNAIRLKLGYLVLLGLEFIIGADIIESIVKADYYSIGLLAVLVVIRTVLSYFLNKELSLISQEAKKEENL